MYHCTNSPGTLNVKESVKTREHDSCREHCTSREPPRYYFGKRVSLPECSCRWPWSDVFPTWILLPGAASTKGMLDFLSGDKTIYCTKPLLERAEQDGETIRRAATDQEHRPRVRADQAHRARLIARSTISFGCLSLVKSVFVFVSCFLIALF